ncbi:MAG: sensor histidine kinase [Propioniciclava sp.]
MLSFAQVLSRCDLADDDERWLLGLTEQWGVLADLAFSDLICWVPDLDDSIFWAAAQCRPTNAPTALADDVVGEDIAYDAEHLVTEAYLSREIAVTSASKLDAGIPVDVQAVPVIRRGRCIAIVEMHTNRMGVRAPGALEDAYLEAAEILMGMVHRAEFPMAGDKPVEWSSPRVGDGLIRVSDQSVVLFASPNAVSIIRRLGWPEDILGEDFQRVLAALGFAQREPVDAAEGLPLDRTSVREFDVETHSGSAGLRVQPLRGQHGSAGWLVLCRDLTEIRFRERQLVQKDATIREIHHRVKNNLQTVAALLRLQERRTSSAEALTALADAQKRVTAIAVVHEMLSQGYTSSVDFDDVADRLLGMVRDVAARGTGVGVARQGTFGSIPAETATHLSLVLTEVVQNALEHGLAQQGGRVVVSVERHGGSLAVDVTNDGAPLPADFSVADDHNLGLSIVVTLVRDLQGTFEIVSLPDSGGTQARLRLQLG